MIFPRNSRAGFTLLELVIVVAIIMVVTAMATPAIVSAVADYRLRTAASGLAGVIQKGRMQAVSDDRWYPVHMGPTGRYAFVDLNNNNTVDTAERTLVVYLGRGITLDSGGGPSLSSMNLDFTPATGLPAFNARGLPCTPSGSVCTIQTGAGGAQGWSGYIYYLRQERSLGTPSWAAVTVTPAGRVKAWTWTGGAWN